MDISQAWDTCDSVARVLPLLTGETSDVVQAALFGLGAVVSAYAAKPVHRLDCQSPGFCVSPWGLDHYDIETGLYYLCVSREACEGARKLMGAEQLSVLLAGHPAGLQRWLMTDDGAVAAAVLARCTMLASGQAVPVGLEGQAQYWEELRRGAFSSLSIKGYKDAWEKVAEPVAKQKGREVIV